MGTTWFIAKRLILSSRSQFTSFILRMGIAGVAVSIAVMIVSTGVARGFQTEISQKVFSFWGHLHFTHFQSFRSLESYPLNLADVDTEVLMPGPVRYHHTPGFLGREFDALSYDRYTRGGVAHIQQFAYKPGILRTRELMDGLIMKGLTYDLYRPLLETFVTEGVVPVYTDTATSPLIMISESTARRLSLQVGDRVRGYFADGRDELVRNLEVTAIYKTGIEEHDSRYFIGDLNLIRNINQWEPGQTGGFEIFLDNFQDLRPIYEHLYYEITEPTQYVSSIQSVFPNLFGWLQLQRTNEQVIFLLMLMVAVINMCTALLILIMEHSRHIGIFKTLGMAGAGIKRIFLVYAAIVVIAGQGLGNLAGLLFSYLQQRYQFITLPEEAYYLSYAPVHVEWPVLLLINFLAFVAIMLSLFLPLAWVSRIREIKVLRFH